MQEGRNLIFKKTGIVFFNLLVLCCTTLYASEPVVSVEGIYWLATLKAEGKFVDNNIGERLDFVDDLGISDRDLPAARLTFRIGENHRLRLGYIRMDYDGKKTLRKDIEFAGKVYSFGEKVKTDLDIQQINLAWTWQFVNLIDDRLRLGTVVDLKFADIKAQVRSARLGRESTDLTFALPTAGIAADALVSDRFGLFAEATGITAGKYGWLADAETGLRIRPVSNIGISGGYRVLFADVEYGGNSLDMRINGPFVGVSISF